MSSTLVIGIPMFFKNDSVPPVEKISTPKEFNSFAIGSIPFLSKTEINADLIFNIFEK